jgi:hypothetical protein
LLAMVVNDNACGLVKRGALESIASKLAPTGTGYILNSRVGCQAVFASKPAPTRDRAHAENEVTSKPVKAQKNGHLLKQTAAKRSTSGARPLKPYAESCNPR